MSFQAIILPQSRSRFTRSPLSSALVTHQIAASALPRPSAVRIRLAITESEAAKIGILDRWQAAEQRRRDRTARKSSAQAALNVAFSRLMDYAEVEKLSLRKIGAKIGIPERTLRRIRDHQINPLVWLPKLTAALSRLNLKPQVKDSLLETPK